MNVRPSILEIFTVFLLVSLANCFSGEFETGQLQKAKRKAMRNSLVRFGKRAGAVPRSLFPFYDGFGALRLSRSFSNSLDSLPAAKYEEDDLPNDLSIISDSAMPRPEIVSKASRPLRYNFLRYRRDPGAEIGSETVEGNEPVPIWVRYMST